jgi:hypothetical protein
MIYATLTTAACLVLLYSSFCRLLKTDKGTLLEIRHGFALMGAASVAVLLALWVRPEWLPHAWLLLLGSMVWIQLSTARHWRNAAPAAFATPLNKTDFADTRPPERLPGEARQYDAYPGVPVARVASMDEIVRHIP